MKLKIKCDWCDRVFEKHPSRITKHNFCCRECLAAFSSKKCNPGGYRNLKDYSNIASNLSALNREMNPTRMTKETREKIRQSRIGTGAGKTYSKFYGRHEHRVVAEQILGRELHKGEVVHHRDGNKRNNDPRNIVVFNSQAEHAHHHAELNWFNREIEIMEGGDAE